MSLVTLITVNYKNAEATLGLLHSLEKQTNTDFDVIVVDNDSGDDDRGTLGGYAATTPLRLEVIYSDSNRGFSGGNNLAIRKALAQGAQWICLINNDTTVEPDCIASLNVSEHLPGLIGLPLDEGGPIAYAGLVRWLTPTLPHLYAIPTSECAYAIGAGMLIHRSTLEKVGSLDERYFLYFEDADYSMRVKKTGEHIAFLRAPIITHAVSGSTARLGSPRLWRYHARNMFLFNRLHGPWWVQALLPFAAFYGIIFSHKSIKAGILDYYGNRFGPITHDHRN